MGLLDLVLGSDNPVSQWANDNSNTLGAFGAGLATGGWRNGLRDAAQNIPTAKMADKVQQLQRTQQNRTVQYLQQNGAADLVPLVLAGHGTDALSIYQQRQNRQPVDPTASYEGRIQAGREQGLSGDALSTYALTSKLPGGNQTPRAGVGQPLFGRNKKTNQIEPWQSMTDGTMVNIANPSANPADYDFNPAIGSQARASGTAQGRIGGTAAGSLPIAAQTAENALATIQKLRGLNPDGTSNARMSQGIDETFGNFGPVPQQMIPDWLTVPGTAKADYKTVLNQGGGQAFLTAYQQLRGAGAITEMEGQKAGDAIARMQTSQSKDAFQQALSDYEAIIKAGYARLQQQAVESGGADPSAIPQLTSGTTAGGLNWSVSQ